VAQRERGCDSHSVLGLRVWLARQPFRLAPAWATLAGALASGGLRWQRKDGLLLLLAIILADGLWGQLWTLLVRQVRLASGGHAEPTARLLPLPYVAPESPVSRLWRWLAGDAGQQREMQPTAAWRALLMNLPFTVGLALLLGPAALVMTALALLIASLASVLLPRRWGGALAQSLFEIGLAWLLGHLLFAGFAWPVLPLLLAAGYVLLQASSLALHGRHGLWLVNLAQLVPLACLVTAEQPLAAGVLGITLLTPLAWQTWVGQGEEGGLDARGYQKRAQIWWWAGMLVAAWAVG